MKLCQAKSAWTNYAVFTRLFRADIEVTDLLRVGPGLAVFVVTAFLFFSVDTKIAVTANTAAIATAVFTGFFLLHSVRLEADFFNFSNASLRYSSPFSLIEDDTFSLSDSKPFESPVATI